jgi:hypothetical protein
MSNNFPIKEQRKPLLGLIALLFIVPSFTMAESGFVVFDPVDLEKTLPGSAFYLSCGPGAKVEVPLKMDGMEASGTWTVSRLLRVTLFETEGLFSMWVERIHVNRAGGSRVQSCSALSFHSLLPEHPWVGPFRPRSVTWVDPLTFELEDQAQWVDGEANSLMTEPRLVRFTYVEDGAFLVSKGAEW